MALKFRTTGMKKSTKHRIILLVVVFLAALVFFYILLNRHTTPNVSQMSTPTLPTVSVNSFGTDQLLLHGYTSKMNASEMTDNLIPLDTDRKLSFNVNTYGNSIEKASYEIRSSDSESRTISTDSISNLNKKSSKVTFDTSFTNLLNPGVKYTLILNLTSGRKDIHYYSQIVISQNSHMKELINFAQDFHNTSLSDDYNSLSRYLEPSNDLSGGNISHVNIHSSINDIGMNGFSHKIKSEPIIAVTNMTRDTASINISYILEHGSKASYLTTEKYRIRYGSPRMYLLSFDRKLDIIPNYDSFSVKNKSLLLGASAEKPVVSSNEPGSVAAFVQSGALFEYSVNQNRITSVFSFLNDPTDPRSLINDHDIQILNIDASGSMDFVVYGYMNSGSHEGESGIDIYHYDSSLNIATEEGFINSAEPLSYLRKNFSELLHRTSGGRFYCLLNRNLLGIDLATKKTDVIIKNLKDVQYCVSDDMRYIAWTSTEKPDTSISVLDLSLDKVYKIKASGSDRLRALCFMNEDLVYGTVNFANLDKGYMSSLNIVSFKNEKLTTIKKYQKSDVLITSVSSSGNSLVLKRSRTDGTKISSDTILDTLSSESDVVSLSTATDKDSVSVRAISFKKLSSDRSGVPDYRVSALALSDSTISLDLYK
ncbi:MAG: hypothetical protein FRC54_08525 [bacterium LCO1.1]|uniref:Uncharacterized protein n=1 Tax=Candidatus Weimeria bifida TaxID=2599074 RepID=A0A6N7J1T8_9FIRM|nr:hypothetical protein [Candidatus Weimeria bifida]